MDSNLERFFTPFLFVGFLGAFTTFSAFSKESLELINSGHFIMASSYVLISVFSCLGATWLGIFLTKG
jgi:CrcB protein